MCVATLDPHIDAFGSISLSWRGPRLIISDKPYSVKESGYGLTYTSYLTMSDVEKQDKGEYTCIVRVAGDRNILGTVVSESISVSMSKSGELLSLDVRQTTYVLAIT